MPAPASAAPAPGTRAALFACAALLLLFAFLSLSATLSKSATMDEPLHATGAYLQVFERDFRMNPEDPPLWKYWAMLPHDAQRLRIDRGLPDFEQMLQTWLPMGRFAVTTLYLTPENEGRSFINTTRSMMVLFGLMLGGVIAAWSWRLAGPVAAVVATTLYALDPNFLAHASLIKNDVAISLLFLGIAWGTWSVGRRLRWWNLPLLGLLVGAALATKFSGILVLPIVATALFARAMLPSPWPVGKRAISGRASRLALATAAFAAAAGLGWIVIWGSYGFRYDPTPVPGVRLNMPGQVQSAMRNVYYLRHGRFPAAGDEAGHELAREPLTPLLRFALWADRHRVLPHAYLYGLVFTYEWSLVRPSFLMGQYSDAGWWYYFPLAMLFKTPLATLIAMAIALAAGAYLFRRRQRESHVDTGGGSLDRWTALCLWVPIVVYGASAMMSNLNLGIRHVLPVYPFIHVLIGTVAVRLRAAQPRAFKVVAILLAAALAVETLAAYPNYIPYFNAIFRPHKVHLLSDSNLDWGQDLPLLREWQERNPTKRLYFGYFGAEPPERHGIEYLNLPAGYFLRSDVNWPEEPGVIALSATLLQGTHLPPSLRYYYGLLRQREPREVLGGSIYLYDVPTPPLPRPTPERVEQYQREHYKR